MTRRLQFLLAAPASGSGKTTLARGLMALYTRRGLRVQPFKCGPDYIDTKFHEAVCGRPSINLDTFMAPADHVRRLYDRYAEGADVCIVEGMMGLFDGYDRDRGSAAEIAAVLGLPVVLVVDARSAAYSVAPLLRGFAGFRSDVAVAGVVFNRVGSARHEAMLRQACADAGLPCMGCIPRRAELEQASRYLGLDFSQAAPAPLLQLFDPVGDAILKMPLPDLPLKGEEAPSISSPFRGRPGGGLRQGGGLRPGGGFVAVARNDEAFSFVYQETIDSFGHVVFFDPEREVPPLDGCDLLYLPGGYPEKHPEALAAASATRSAIRDYAERGGRILAECGGMMYLCERIVTDEGDYPMCGVLPYSITARRCDRHLSLGYRRFVLDGQEYRGHEFHYTQFLGDLPPSACEVYDATGKAVATTVIRHKNVLASYTHLYLYEENLH